MTKKLQAFTLIELIVVITILAILGTIGFLSLQGYSKSARDAARISDMKIVEKALSLYDIKNNKFPLPNNYSTIYGSGAEALWYQGNIDTGLLTTLQRISKVPVDPKDQSLMGYSTTLNQKEYQLHYILESDLVDYSIIGQSYAAINAPRVKGNYNGLFLVGDLGGYYAIPSLFSGSGTVSTVPVEFDIDGETIFATGSLLTNTGGVAITTSNIETNYAAFALALQSAYIGTGLEDNPKYKALIQMDPSEAESVGALLASGGSISISVVYPGCVFDDGVGTPTDENKFNSCIFQ